MIIPEKDVVQENQYDKKMVRRYTESTTCLAG
jgi:hypothetical protein